MDTKALVKSLNRIFCETNKAEKKYSEVWLAEVDFGGMYQNDMFTLVVKAEHKIGNCAAEIKSILGELSEKAPEELKLIWNVRVLNADNRVHCESEALKIYDTQLSCQ